ncbi:uncharacterized protein LTR77_001493 [Saxophila tyrrhenica]|uniref:Bromodomain associated domain-containing protein n=1 Tax=Saxophila tyrrhenica TaxID=1690608 RepID=A0AAV9PMZ5_9PEZI|nr:hypothetical protein LTR77_001493 [Saxophila tyrrhenica]
MTTPPPTLQLHRALLRPAILTTLRAAGFHSTRPSVLDTLVQLVERYILLLATTTAAHARNSHNTPVPGVGDARMALEELGVLGDGVEGGVEEAWREKFRVPVEVMGEVDVGGEARKRAERTRRAADAAGVAVLEGFLQGKEYAEIKRVAGMTGENAGVGVGGGRTRVEDFLTGVKRRQGRVGDVEGEERLVGTVLGREREREDGEAVVKKRVRVDGGPQWEEWEGRVRERARSQAGRDQVEGEENGRREARAVEAG